MGKTVITAKHVAYNHAQREEARAKVRAAGYKIVGEGVSPVSIKFWLVSMEAKEDDAVED